MSNLDSHGAGFRSTWPRIGFHAISNTFYLCPWPSTWKSAPNWNDIVPPPRSLIFIKITTVHLSWAFWTSFSHTARSATRSAITCQIAAPNTGTKKRANWIVTIYWCFPPCRSNRRSSFSPFVVRQREVKRREESIVRSSKNSFTEFLFGKKSSPSPSSPTVDTWKGKKNPSVAGVSSTASTLSNGSDSDDLSLSSSQEFVDWMDEHPGLEEIGEEAAETTAEHAATFQSLLRVMDAGVARPNVHEPDPFNLSLYQGWGGIMAKITWFRHFNLPSS